MKDIKTEVHLYYDGGHSVILSILFTDRVVSSNETLFNLILGRDLLKMSAYFGTLAEFAIKLL